MRDSRFNITPVYKKMTELMYQTTGLFYLLQSVVRYVMEHIVYPSVMEHLNQHNRLDSFQYGFRRGLLVKHNNYSLAFVVEDILFTLDNLYQVDLILIDFESIRRCPPSSPIA